MKYMFEIIAMWNDDADDLTYIGSIPRIIVLPDGQRLDFSGRARAVATYRWEDLRSHTKYIPLDSGVKFRMEWNGDNPLRRLGRRQGVMEIIAPAGTQFEFEEMASPA